MKPLTEIILNGGLGSTMPALQAACAGKTRYASHAAALDRIKLHRRSDRRPRPPRAYRCDLCGFWHVGGNA